MVMRSKGTINTFLNDLCTYEAERVFNPWTTNCERVDVSDSFGIRRENLRTVLCACADANEVDVWVGRDLGWRGGRRTGVALVDEYSLDNYALSIEVTGLKKATASPVMRERTATEIHLARIRVSRKIFFWNVFPFHPHEEGNPHSNRLHTRREHDVGLEFLKNVLVLLPVSRVVTIGNDATNALQAVGVGCLPVRHPSYGGQKDFHQQVDDHYRIIRRNDIQGNLFGSDSQIVTLPTHTNL
jgi:hypothetical protein